MKIAHVVGTFPPHFGGMGCVAFEEAKRLSELGHEVTVFTMRYPGFSYQKYDWPFQVERLKPWLKFGDAGLVPQLVGRLKGYDIVHLHYPFFGGAEMVWWASILHRQKYILTYHMDAKPDSFFKKIVQAKYNFVYSRAICRRAEKILVVDNNFFAQSRLRNKISQPVVELWNGVDERVFRPLPGVKETPRYTLLFVGNLMAVKSLDLVFKALKVLPAEFKLVVVGGGYAEENYERQVGSLGLVERVQFVGAIANKETLNDYYNCADCTIIPASDTESFSLVALESLASGTPVIVSDLPGTRGRVINGQDGLSFMPGQVEDLKQKIEDFFAKTQEERKKMGEAGRERISRLYTWDKHLEKLVAVYEEIV